MVERIVPNDDSAVALDGRQRASFGVATQTALVDGSTGGSLPAVVGSGVLLPNAAPLKTWQAGHAEIGAVEKIEGFDAKLRFDAFGQMRVLDGGQVEGAQVRADERVAPDVAERA